MRLAYIFLIFLLSVSSVNAAYADGGSSTCNQIKNNLETLGNQLTRSLTSGESQNINEKIKGLSALYDVNNCKAFDAPSASGTVTTTQSTTITESGGIPVEVTYALAAVAVIAIIGAAVLVMRKS